MAWPRGAILYSSLAMVHQLLQEAEQRAADEPLTDQDRDRLRRLRLEAAWLEEQMK